MKKGLEYCVIGCPIGVLKRVSLRFISALTANVFFLTSTVGAVPVTALPWQGNDIAMVMPLSIQIPAELGTIKSSFQSRNPKQPTIILIEDAHANYSAQVKIKELLAYLQEKEGIQTGFVEGAAAPLDVSKFRFFDDSKLNNEIANALAEKGEITGIELFLMSQDESFKAIGIENLELYAENLAVFQDVLKYDRPTRGFVSALRHELMRLSSQDLNQDLRQYLNHVMTYRDGKLSLVDYLPILKRTAAESLKLDLLDPKSQIRWPQLVRLAHLRDIEASMDKEAIGKELESAVTHLSSTAMDPELITSMKSYLTLKYEAGLAKRIQGKEVTLRSFFETFYAKAQKYSFDFGNYPALRDYVTNQIFQDELDGLALEEEIGALTDKLFGALAFSDHGKNIVSLFKDVRLLEEGFSLALSREEALVFKYRNAALTPESLIHRVQSLIEGSSLKQFRQNVPTDEIQKLNVLSKKVSHFYELARKREDVLVANLLAAIEQVGVKKAVLIAGGFHTQGIRHLLQEHDLSYTVVMPHITDVDVTREQYYRLVAGFSPKRSKLSHVVQVILAGLSPDADAFAIYDGGEDVWQARANEIARIIAERGGITLEKAERLSKQLRFGPAAVEAQAEEIIVSTEPELAKGIGFGTIDLTTQQLLAHHTPQDTLPVAVALYAIAGWALTVTYQFVRHHMGKNDKSRKEISLTGDFLRRTQDIPLLGPAIVAVRHAHVAIKVRLSQREDPKAPNEGRKGLGFGASTPHGRAVTDVVLQAMHKVQDIYATSAQLIEAGEFELAHLLDHKEITDPEYPDYRQSKPLVTITPEVWKQAQDYRRQNEEKIAQHPKNEIPFVLVDIAGIDSPGLYYHRAYMETITKRRGIRFSFTAFFHDYLESRFSAQGLFYEGDKDLRWSLGEHTHPGVLWGELYFAQWIGKEELEVFIENKRSDLDDLEPGGDAYTNARVVMKATDSEIERQRKFLRKLIRRAEKIIRGKELTIDEVSEYGALYGGAGEDESTDDFDQRDLLKDFVTSTYAPANLPVKNLLEFIRKSAVSGPALIAGFYLTFPRRPIYVAEAFKRPGTAKDQAYWTQYALIRSVVLRHIAAYLWLIYQNEGVLDTSDYETVKQAWLDSYSRFLTNRLEARQEDERIVVHRTVQQFQDILKSFEDGIHRNIKRINEAEPVDDYVFDLSDDEVAFLIKPLSGKTTIRWKTQRTYQLDQSLGRRVRGKLTLAGEIKVAPDLEDADSILTHEIRGHMPGAYMLQTDPGKVWALIDKWLALPDFRDLIVAFYKIRVVDDYPISNTAEAVDEMDTEEVMQKIAATEEWGYEREGQRHVDLVAVFSEMVALWAQFSARRGKIDDVTFNEGALSNYDDGSELFRLLQKPVFESFHASFNRFVESQGDSFRQAGFYDELDDIIQLDVRGIAECNICWRKYLPGFLENAILPGNVTPAIFEALFERMLVDHFQGRYTLGELRRSVVVSQSDTMAVFRKATEALKRQAREQAEQRFKMFEEKSDAFAKVLMDQVLDVFGEDFSSELAEEEEPGSFLRKAAHDISHAVSEDVVVKRFVLEEMNRQGVREIDLDSNGIPAVAKALRAMKVFAFKRKITEAEWQKLLRVDTVRRGLENLVSMGKDLFHVSAEDRAKFFAQDADISRPAGGTDNLVVRHATQLPPHSSRAAGQGFGAGGKLDSEEGFRALVDKLFVQDVAQQMNRSEDEVRRMSKEDVPLGILQKALPRAKQKAREIMDTPPVPEEGEQSGGTPGGRAPGHMPEFFVDLTEKARRGEIDGEVYERDQVIVDIANRFALPKNASFLMTAEYGVGKTTITHLLAHRMIRNETGVSNIDGGRLLELDVAQFKAMAGTSVQSFVGAVLAFLGEAKKPKTFVVIDEFHRLAPENGIRGVTDLFYENLLKPLADGEARILAITTSGSYRQFIEPDTSGLIDRFGGNPYPLKPLTAEQSVRVLRNVARRIERHYNDHLPPNHHVHISEEAIDAAVDLTERVFPQRVLVRKAEDYLTKATGIVASRNSLVAQAVRDLKRDVAREVNLMRISLQKKREKGIRAGNAEISRKVSDLFDKFSLMEEGFSYDVNPDDVVEALVQSGVPTHTIDGTTEELLDSLAERIKKKIRGQDQLIDQIVNIVKANFDVDGLGKPLGTFWIDGATGVGKTELAKQLAILLMGAVLRDGREDPRFFKINAEEFKEDHEIARLLGAPPGYIGYNPKGGLLTRRVRENPHSVVLVDEADKATPEFFDAFLGIIDGGYTVTPDGTYVDFSKVIIIFTSNLGFQSPKSKEIMATLNDAWRRRMSLQNDVAQLQGEANPDSHRLSQLEADLAALNEVIKTKLEEYRTMSKEVTREAHRTEFWNKMSVGEPSVADPLSPEIAREIVSNVKLPWFEEQFSRKGIEIEYLDRDAVVDYLLKHGFDAVNGARPLERVIRDELAIRIQNQFPRRGVDSLVEGDSLVISVSKEDRITIERVRRVQTVDAEIEFTSGRKEAEPVFRSLTDLLKSPNPWTDFTVDTFDQILDTHPDNFVQTDTFRSRLSPSWNAEKATQAHSFTNFMPGDNAELETFIEPFKDQLGAREKDRTLIKKALRTLLDELKMMVNNRMANALANGKSMKQLLQEGDAASTLVDNVLAEARRRYFITGEWFSDDTTVRIRLRVPVNLSLIEEARWNDRLSHDYKDRQDLLGAKDDMELALAKLVLNNSDGTLGYQRHGDQGTTIWVELPINMSSQAESDTGSGLSPSQRPTATLSARSTPSFRNEKREAAIQLLRQLYPSVYNNIRENVGAVQEAFSNVAGEMQLDLVRLISRFKNSSGIFESEAELIKEEGELEPGSVLFSKGKFYGVLGGINEGDDEYPIYFSEDSTDGSISEESLTFADMKKRRMKILRPHVMWTLMINNGQFPAADETLWTLMRKYYSTLTRQDDLFASETQDGLRAPSFLTGSMMKAFTTSLKGAFAWSSSAEDTIAVRGEVYFTKKGTPWGLVLNGEHELNDADSDDRRIGYTLWQHTLSETREINILEFNGKASELKVLETDQIEQYLSADGILDSGAIDWKLALVYLNRLVRKKVSNESIENRLGARRWALLRSALKTVSADATSLQSLVSNGANILDPKQLVYDKKEEPQGFILETDQSDEPPFERELAFTNGETASESNAGNYRVISLDNLRTLFSENASRPVSRRAERTSPSAQVELGASERIRNISNALVQHWPMEPASEPLQDMLDGVPPTLTADLSALTHVVNGALISAKVSRFIDEAGNGDASKLGKLQRDRFGKKLTKALGHIIQSYPDKNKSDLVSAIAVDISKALVSGGILPEQLALSGFRVQADLPDGKVLEILISPPIPDAKGPNPFEQQSKGFGNNVFSIEAIEEAITEHWPAQHRSVSLNELLSEKNGRVLRVETLEQFSKVIAEVLGGDEIATILDQARVRSRQGLTKEEGDKLKAVLNNTISNLRPPQDRETLDELSPKIVIDLLVALAMGGIIPLRNNRFNNAALASVEVSGEDEIGLVAQTKLHPEDVTLDQLDAQLGARETPEDFEKFVDDLTKPVAEGGIKIIATHIKKRFNQFELLRKFSLGFIKVFDAVVVPLLTNLVNEETQGQENQRWPALELLVNLWKEGSDIAKEFINERIKGNIKFLGVGDRGLSGNKNLWKPFGPAISAVYRLLSSDELKMTSYEMDSAFDHASVPKYVEVILNSGDIEERRYAYDRLVNLWVRHDSTRAKEALLRPEVSSQVYVLGIKGIAAVPQIWDLINEPIREVIRTHFFRTKHVTDRKDFLQRFSGDFVDNMLNVASDTSATLSERKKALSWIMYMDFQLGIPVDRAKIGNRLGEHIDLIWSAPWPSNLYRDVSKFDRTYDQFIVPRLVSFVLNTDKADDTEQVLSMRDIFVKLVALASKDSEVAKSAIQNDEVASRIHLLGANALVQEESLWKPFDTAIRRAIRTHFFKDRRLLERKDNIDNFRKQFFMEVAENILELMNSGETDLERRKKDLSWIMYIYLKESPGSNPVEIAGELSKHVDLIWQSSPGGDWYWSVSDFERKFDMIVVPRLVKFITTDSSKSEKTVLKPIDAAEKLIRLASINSLIAKTALGQSNVKQFLDANNLSGKAEAAIKPAGFGTQAAGDERDRQQREFFEAKRWRDKQNIRLGLMPPQRFEEDRRYVAKLSEEIKAEDGADQAKYSEYAETRLGETYSEYVSRAHHEGKKPLPYSGRRLKGPEDLPGGGFGAAVAFAEETRKIYAGPDQEKVWKAMGITVEKVSLDEVIEAAALVQKYQGQKLVELLLRRGNINLSVEQASALNKILEQGVAMVTTPRYLRRTDAKSHAGIFGSNDVVTIVGQRKGDELTIQDLIANIRHAAKVEGKGLRISNLRTPDAIRLLSPNANLGGVVVPGILHLEESDQVDGLVELSGELTDLEVKEELAQSIAALLQNRLTEGVRLRTALLNLPEFSALKKQIEDFYGLNAQTPGQIIRTSLNAQLHNLISLANFIRQAVGQSA